MKSKILYGLLITLIFIGCEDIKFGNDFLEKPNSDNIPIDTVFATKKYADQALNAAYKSLWDFMPTQNGSCNLEGLILDCYTDLGYGHTVKWATGTLTSSNRTRDFQYQLVSGDKVGDPSYGIRKSYIYIENVDKVVDMSAEEKKIRKAEAKVIIASHYVNMIRFYGGMPWMDHAYLSTDELKFIRLTFENTVNKTIELIDEAAADLPWYTTDEEYGHMTAAAAIGLKTRLLNFAASPLTNTETSYVAGEAADKRITLYGNYDVNRWKRALDAGLEFIESNQANGDHYRIENTGNPREDYINGYFVKGNKEVIMASFRWGTYQRGLKPFRMYDDGYGLPRANYADMFQWKADGADFDWNNAAHSGSPFFDNNGIPTRDIRMYESLLVNGDKWQNRKAEVYIFGREGFGPGSKIKQKTKYGYGFRKFVRDTNDEMKNKPYSCPLIRMPEIFLNMAEAMNHLGIAEQADKFGNTAYDYINMVYERAGMPPLTSARVAPGDDLTNFLLDERAREFGQENVRYFDMIRYKKGAEWATRPVEMLETKKNKDGTFTYNRKTLEPTKYIWVDQYYFMPFPVSEINKGYGLIQNPGW